MILIAGTKFHVSGSDKTAEQHRCDRCGFFGQFVRKSGRNYITLFFVLPVIPIGKSKNMLECPNCKTRYQTNQ
jgi:hypothetical protein